MPSRPTSRPAGRILAGGSVWVIAAVLLAGCGSTPEAAVTTSSDPLVGQVCCVVPSYGQAEVVNGIETAHNGWDNYLVSWLAPHDAVASQMAELAPAQASSQQVKDIAAAIDAQTAPRYLELSAMAAAWSQAIPSTDPNDAIGHSHGGGVNEADTAQTLVALTGAAFDKEFLKLMIAHHQASLPVVASTLSGAENEKAIEMAKSVAAAQTPEIATMQALLATMP